MKKRALITGLTGQDGSYLAELLLSKDYEVFGLARRVSTPNYVNIEKIIDKITIISGDMTDPISLMHAVKDSQPEEIYNLAAQSYVGASWRQPHLTTAVTGVGALNMIEATREYANKAKFYQASTSELFGNSNTNGTQNENTPFEPRSPYGFAKLYAFHAIKNYRESYNMFACNGILFNHESERRGMEFVTRKVTNGVAMIKHGLAKEIKLGNLDSKRDWGFAGDYVEAMWLMLQQQKPEDFVIATGQTHSVRELVEKSFNCAGIKDWEQYVIVDPNLVRPAEVFTLKGDASKANNILGWKPKMTFDQLVESMVKSDIDRLGKA